MHNEINNKNENKYKTKINSKNNITKYKCIFHCPLLHNDIASSIDIDNNYLVYGTFMGEVALCLIDEFYFQGKNNSHNLNNTNDMITIDDEQKDKIKEIKLKTKDKSFNKNKNSFSKIKQRKKIKDFKVYSNKEHESEDFQQTEDIHSANLNDKLKNDNKIINNFDSNRIKRLYQNKFENISCVSLLNDVLNFSIGDYQLIHCEKISSFIGRDIKYAYKFRAINNYISEKSHNEFCETAQCFMTKTNYLIIYSFYFSFDWPLKFNQVKYENRNLLNFDVIKGSIYMSNYNVPFDFDGDKFLYLEHYNKEIRCICIFSTLKEEKIFQYFIENEFGHISFMKLLPDNNIFLCRKIYLCEIYKIIKNVNNKDMTKIDEINIKKNEDFTLLKSWTHVQDYEIISSNIYIINNENKKEEKINENNLIHLKIKKNRDNIIKNRNHIPYLKLLQKENSFDSYSSKSKYELFHFDNNNESNNYNNIGDLIQSEKIKDDIIKFEIKNNNNHIIERKTKYYIITLDIEGNFNLYNNDTENDIETKTTLFNLYDIENIETKYKKVKFFALGFPYYITMNNNYYVVTTDNGIFVINSEKEGK